MEMRAAMNQPLASPDAIALVVVSVSFDCQNVAMTRDLSLPES